MFHNLVNQQINLKIRLKNNSDIDEAVNNLTKIIHSAAVALTFTTNKPAQMHTNSQILPAQIRSLIVEKRRARAQYHYTRLPSHKVVDAISSSLEKKQYCTSTFLDLSQAFDRVWHQGLLYKLRKCLPSALFLLIKSYLDNRHFQIRLGTAFSNIAAIHAGVPQGGILSPILFNIFVSDQPTLANTLVADYADDKAIMSIHENPEIASASLQLHLDLMADWYKKMEGQNK
ncbi:hypothetical protein QTP88_009460 [Uroleucon formosanum]